MKILICPDKFKGSLTASQVCEAVEAGLRKVYPDASIQSVPLADGGEGTCSLLTAWHEGTHVSLEALGPLFTPLTAGYGISRDGLTAFIEMAEVSGLMLLRENERNPLYTTSIGTGQLIADALDRGVSAVVLGVGGSATNDAGIGMATALGYRFVDAANHLLRPVGENLIHIRQIFRDTVHPRVKDVSFTVLCDVTNSLYGKEGAAYVYGPQKGADSAAIELLDAGLRNFRHVVHKQLRIPVDFPGAGAAGGMGAGARVFLNADIRRGISYIVERTGLLAKIGDADVIITGEGKIDNQTFSGKVVSEILKLTAPYHKRVIAVCGVSEVSQPEASKHGIGRIISLVDGGTTTEEAMANAAALIEGKIIRDCKDLHL